MKSILRIVLPLILVFTISSCKKDDENSPLDNGSSGQTVTATFRGFIRDTEGNGIPGATVSAGGMIAVTNSFGGYAIHNVYVSKKRAVIEVNKSGYLKQQRAVIAENGSENRVDLMMFSDNKSYTINAVTGGTISMSGGTTITFPSNAFVTSTGTAYSGTVYITAYEILTSDSNFIDKVPGGDLMAIDSSGDEAMLISYGMAGAELYDASGNELKIAPGKSATIKFPINPSQSAIAPMTIPLWHYDEEDMIWKEEGAANRNGNYYEGSVKHFSPWNCDVPVKFRNSPDVVRVKFTISRCGNEAAKFEKVQILANGVISSTGYTNSSGVNELFVLTNQIFTVHCYGLTGIMDTSFTIGPFTSQSDNQISFQINNCFSTQVSLHDCYGFPANGIVNLFSSSNFVGTYYTVAGNTLLDGLVPDTYTIVANNHFTQTTSFTVSTTDPSAQVISMNLCVPISNPINGILDLSITNWPTTSIHHLRIKELIVQGSNISMQCVDTISYENWSININNSAYQANIYPWAVSGNSISMARSGSGSAVNYSSVSGNTTLYECPLNGGSVEGIYSGTMTSDDGTGSPFQVQVNADFEGIWFK